MGCWNETCMVSNLPIHSGNRVVAIPIIENIHDHCGVYATDYWGIFLPPVRGTYDDYGSIEGTYDPVFESIAKSFLSPEGSSDELRKLNGDEFINAFISEISRQEYQVDFSATATHIGLSKFLVEHIKALENKKVRVVFIHEEIFDEMIAKSERAERMWRYIHENAGDKEPDYARGIYYERQHGYPARYILLHLLRFFGNDTLKRRVEEMAKFTLALDEMRMCYHPTSGSGSQAGINQLTIDIKEKIAEMANYFRFEENV